MVKILIADDHELVRETIAAYLRQTDRFEVFPVSDMTEAGEALAQDPEFDLILLDYRMPGMESLDGIEQVRGLAPDVPVALISGAASTEVARQAMELGAAGFIPKTLTPADLVGAVQVLSSGGTYMPEDALANMAHSLTPREVEVVRGIAGGKSNKEIARDLGVQEVTIKLHVKTLSRKLDARNRTHAAMRARDLGLV